MNYFLLQPQNQDMMEENEDGREDDAYFGDDARLKIETEDGQSLDSLDDALKPLAGNPKANENKGVFGSAQDDKPAEQEPAEEDEDDPYDEL